LGRCTKVGVETNIHRRELIMSENLEYTIANLRKRISEMRTKMNIKQNKEWQEMYENADNAMPKTQQEKPVDTSKADALKAKLLGR